MKQAHLIIHAVHLIFHAFSTSFKLIMILHFGAPISFCTWLDETTRVQINWRFSFFQRPRPQSKAGHDEQGGEIEEEECQSESQTKGPKSHKDIDQEKIDFLSTHTDKIYVDIKRRNFQIQGWAKSSKSHKDFDKTD